MVRGWPLNHGLARGVLKKKKKESRRDASRKEHSRGCTLFHVQDMSRTQDHRDRIEQ